MSEPPPANLTFLPWLRRGLATEITHPDSPAPRATVPIQLTIRAEENSITPEKIDLALFGPGEVGGIDPRMIIRTYPQPEVYDAEGNYFPAIEFDQPDFPWRYTPTPPDDETGHLQPWLVLLVLADDELAPPDDEVPNPKPAGPDGTLPQITVKVGNLPDLSQSWAWAHVQVSGTIETEGLKDLVENEPHRILSRLLCLRHLKPRTAYTAYLVPSFERGRRAGLNEAMDDDVDGQQAAWPSFEAGDETPVTLPVYYQWRFQTGVVGDFEYWIKQLRYRPLRGVVGRREMDVSDPGIGLPPASSKPLGLEGALQLPPEVSASPEAPGEEWKTGERDTFLEGVDGQNGLKSLLNRPADLLEDQNTEDAVVTPPLYGQWHVAQAKLAPGQEPDWFHELNADPRLRSVASLGARVVQEQQQQLLASAWDQVEGVLEINEKLRQAQLARETDEQVHARHLESLNPEVILLVSAPLHSRIRDRGMTIQASTNQSPIAEGAFDGQFRRVIRPFGPIGKRQGRSENLGQETTLLERMNSGELSPASPPPKPENMATPSNTEFLGGALANLQKELVEYQSSEPDPADLDKWFDIAEGEPGDHEPKSKRSGNVDKFLKALIDLLDQVGTPPDEGQSLQPIDIPKLQSQILEATKPQKTIEAPLRRRLQIAPWVAEHWQPSDPIEPVLAAPEFNQPMYKALCEMGQEWLLPGVGNIPANTALLLEPNHRFVESYMLGLNHEMARELLWQEYPTDQRGTYFRQFWDVRGHIPADVISVAPESLKDIKPINEWGRLGDNSNRDEAPLVLLIRSEALRRYPNTVVYAVQAQQDEDGTKSLKDDKQRYPLFQGTFEPDIAFFGFDLDQAEIGGDPGEGWYIIFQEQPTEPRFGTDIEASSGEDGENNGDSTIYWSSWEQDEPDAAIIAKQRFQSPFRLAIHASNLLPEGESNSDG